MRIYTTENTCLFVANDDFPTPMFATGVRDINWIRTEKATVCGNCNSFIGNAPTCKQCGAPGGNATSVSCATGSATALLFGILPTSSQLVELRNGDTIHILYKECGRPDVYDKRDVFAILSNIEIIKTSIPDVCCLYPGNIQQISIYVEIECNFILKV